MPDSPDPNLAPDAPATNGADGGMAAMDADLTSQVDSLLRDIETSTSTTNEAMADPPPASAVDLEAVRREALIAMQAQQGDAGAEPGVSTQAAPIVEASLAQATAEVVDLAPPTPVTTPASAPPSAPVAAAVPEDLLSSVQAALQESAPSVPTPAIPKARAAIPMNVAALDEQIASSTDEVLATEAAVDAATLAVAAVGVVSAAGGGKHQPAAAHPAPGAPSPSAAATDSPAPAKKAALVQASVVHAAATLAPAAKAATERGKRAVGVLEEPILRVMELISKPLAQKPKVWRDSIGYLAASTCFFGCVLWGYVLFFRTPENAAAQGRPFDFATSGLPSAEKDLHADPHAVDDHAGSSSGHGGKGTQSGGSGHGSGDKGKDEKKKPVLNSAGKPSIVNKTIDDTKKAGKGKKDEGKAKSGGH